MIKIEITIPLNYNDGSKIEEHKLEFFKNYILAKFNGLSISNIESGYWLYKNKYYNDDNRTFTIITEDNQDTMNWITNLKHMLKAELRQESIFILLSKCEVI